MSKTPTRTSYSTRYEQLAYQRRIEAFGLSALLAPYTVRLLPGPARPPAPRIPQQRINGEDVTA